MFTKPCFIRKNTPELRKKLEELGYIPPFKIWYDENFAICTIHRDNGGEYVVFKIDDDFERNIAPSYPYIDCGTNEDLFLAIAALRDDTDKNQWFIYDSMDCIIEKLRTVDWFICEENSIEDFAFYDSLYLLCHKATVEEIIEHFTN